MCTGGFQDTWTMKYGNKYSMGFYNYTLRAELFQGNTKNTYIIFSIHNAIFSSLVAPGVVIVASW